MIECSNVRLSKQKALENEINFYIVRKIAQEFRTG
ncbi:hypothetical protein Cha6605_5334 [Chamaesiphon minutus PCC 6605]|uniref:Uncharacterized protein n=1 Tax=Chamaesiphon minutus (strain ATCC 27169 / PCC 6605) TaxID=1173020 RepID=K9UP65_CHAP6|nr:hypothetical protein Cha6605_5334 [Chamaesiphon minutus PCC 6605]